MKKDYFKPEMMVVTVNQKHALLTSPTGSPGPSADFMSNPTISSGSAVKENYNVWDDDWSN